MYKSGFAGKIFKQGNTGISQGNMNGMYLQVAQDIGLKVPPGFQVPLEAMQSIMAGGSFYLKLANQLFGDDQGSDPGIAAAMTVTKMLGQLGLIPPEIEDLSNFAANALIVVGTEGADIQADLGAILSLIDLGQDLSYDFFGDADAAKAEAKRGLSQAIHAYVDPQISKACGDLKAYQAGYLNYFDFVADVALNAPIEFKNFFPGLACFFPTWVTRTFSVTVTSGGLFSSKTDTETRSFVELVTTLAQVKAVLINHFIIAPLQGYFENTWGTKQISLEALSVLAMTLSMGTKGPIEVGFDFNVLGAMRTLGVTPAVLGDDWLFQGRSDWEGNNRPDSDPNFDPDTYLPYPPLTLPLGGKVSSGLAINGVAYLTPEQRKQNAYSDELKALQLQMWKLDQVGDIEALMQIPEARAQLAKYAAFKIDPSWSDYPDILEPTNCDLKPGAVPVSSQSWFDKNNIDQRTKDYVKANYKIDISDYWKALGILKKMSQSNLFSDPENLAYIGSFGTVDSIQKKLKVAHDFIFSKQLNLRAKWNIARYVGAKDPSHLVKRKTGPAIASFDKGPTTVYAVKGK